MKTLLQLGEHDCHWPVGTPPPGREREQLFCAQGKIPGKPYCPACAGVAYDPKTDAAKARMACWSVQVSA